MFCWFNAYPGSRGSLQGEINERREGRASGHIGRKFHFHLVWFRISISHVIGHL